MIVGGGTRLAQANPSRSLTLGLSTLGLAGVDEFEPDEGVVHVLAGTRVRAVQDVVRATGWELPLDSPGATSTIGGTIASAVMGPRAQTFGRVADAILGLEIVTGEGVRTKCGGRVVKNVTGYDLAKLYCGSFGTLGVVTGAWLRLRPLPERQISLFAGLPTSPTAFDAARKFARRRGVRAMVWRSDASAGIPAGLYCELGGGGAEVERDAAEWKSLFCGDEGEGGAIDRIRDGRVTEAPAALDASVMKVALRGRVLGRDLSDLSERIRAAGFAAECDLGLGVVHARGNVTSSAALHELRAFAEGKGGLMSFESLPDSAGTDERGELDRFGSAGGMESMMARLKESLDPKGVLNSGRFKGGI